MENLNPSKRQEFNRPKGKKESKQFPRGEKEILMCKVCNAVYWKKSWHHNLDEYPGLNENKDLSFTICPADQMIQGGKFEGEVVLEKVPENFRAEIINLIENMGKQAYEMDCQDRVISIKPEGESSLMFWTTENQLAIKIAKKIAHTYNGELDIKYSDKEQPARATIVFSDRA